MWLYKLNHFPQGPLEGLLNNLLRKFNLKKTKHTFHKNNKIVFNPQFLNDLLKFEFKKKAFWINFSVEGD